MRANGHTGPRRPEQHLWQHIYTEPNTGCWLWGGLVNPKGYGRLRIGDKKILAHRLSYELYKGKIPEGMQLDHLCRVRCCVNPNHLEAVTLWENQLRGKGFIVANALKTHCPKGHPYSVENTLLDKGSRRCRICTAERNKYYTALRRQRRAQISS